MIYLMVKESYYYSKSRSAYFKIGTSICRTHNYEYKFSSFCRSKIDSSWRVCSRSYSRFKDGFYGCAYSTSLCESGRNV